MTKKYQDEQWLRENYLERRLSTCEMAEICNVGWSTICKWMDKFNIKRRSLSDAHIHPHRLYMDKEWLYEQYWDKGMYLREIAEECGVVDSTISLWMERYGIPRRSNSEARKKAWRDGLLGDDEWHRKQSLATQKAWEDGIYDNRDMSSAVKKAWEDGKFDSPEYRSHLSAAAKKSWRNGKRDKKEIAQKISKGVKRAWARGDFDGVFQSPTSIELAVAEVLELCLLKHISQYRPDSCPYTYDEFIPPCTLVEVHGDYWHGPERPDRQKKDVEKARWAQERGYHLIVIWEHEIKNLGAWPIVRNKISSVIERAL